MLLPNNPEIDTEAANEKLKNISVQRRRATALFGSSQLDAGLKSTGASASIKEKPANWKLMLGIYRRTREIFMPGLHWRQRILLIPVLGSVAAWVYAMVRLPAANQKAAIELAQLRQFEEATKNVLAQFNARLNLFDALQIEQRLDHFDALEVQIQQRLKHLDALAVQTEQRLNHFDALQLEQRLDHFDALQLEQRLNQFDALQLEPRLRQFDAIDIAARLVRLDQFALTAPSDIMTLNNRVAGITRDLRRGIDTAKPVLTPLLATPAPTQNAATDSFYIDFEDTFRGSSSDISERFKVYLPYLDKFSGDASAQVLDIGCGRGEWLALLGQHGIKASGIDLNLAMVDACHELGLQVQCMDALDYLRSQPPASLAAVTGFHIIEHLPFEFLLALLDAALLALRADGLLIFETPNPENLVVGACNFYYDPTHLKPIVPVVAEFMARQRGFAHAEILRLHPYPASYRLTEDSELAKRFNDALYGPQDYALLAWKTDAN